MVRVAVDGMGGDHGPSVIVEGVVMAANDFKHLEIVLVGQQDILKAELNKHKVLGGKITIVEATEVVGMGETPVAALKKKKNSSISICVDLLQKKEVDAAMSAGNTGAMVAASLLNLGMLPGVKRPGIAITIPTLHGMCVTLDVGANLNPSAYELFQYAIMADVFTKNVIKKKRPSIGLLNIGEEESKGTDVLKGAYKLLRESSLNFIGNIEGRDFFTGKADCIICDGFVGNVCLKMIESVLETSILLVNRELHKNPISAIGAWFLKPALANLRRDTNYEEAGGAPLLGVNGNVIISHGISSARAIRNAIRVAGELVTTQVNEQIVEAMTPYLNPSVANSSRNSLAE
ncbi:MAG TPA: phosphate acyltransferase PlsX [Candidatus Omnitrophota bacterium]|nr:phosphate acyltransferase PlsX [Candidatus Omnitrophota bacterium]